MVAWCALSSRSAANVRSGCSCRGVPSQLPRQDACSSDGVHRAESGGCRASGSFPCRWLRRCPREMEHRRFTSCSRSGGACVRELLWSIPRAREVCPPPGGVRRTIEDRDARKLGRRGSCPARTITTHDACGAWRGSGFGPRPRPAEKQVTLDGREVACPNSRGVSTTRARRIRGVRPSRTSRRHDGSTRAIRRTSRNSAIRGPV